MSANVKGAHVELGRQFQYPSPDDDTYEAKEFGRVFSSWGAGDASQLFGESPQTTTPWPNAPRRKDRKPYDQARVKEFLQQPPELEDVDPRYLHSTQPNLTRPGVDYYMGDDYQQTGQTFADQGNEGNRYPVVYSRDDGVNLLLSGHHRGAASLLRGEQMKARRLEGPWG